MSGKQHSSSPSTRVHADLPIPHLTRHLYGAITNMDTAEAEPRRSVRATKGQHSKSLDEIEPAAAPKRRQGKKSKKTQERESPQDAEEVIRCVCGATEQDEDSGEAWISCEDCFAWQHNVCVGVSSYEDEIPEYYWCEQCRPQDHKELLDGIAKGEKPWEARRKAHEEEEADRKKRKGGRRSKGKRNSDGKEETDKDAGRSKAKPSSTPDAAPAVTKEKKEPAAKQGKRKSREDSYDTNGKVILVPTSDGLQLVLTLHAVD